MLSSVDIVVLVLSVIASLAIGLFFAYHGKAKATFVEYFLGGRRLHYIPVAVSLTVTFESSILILGNPAEVYIYGFSHVLMVFGIMTSLAVATHMTVPVFYKMKLVSLFDYITQRFPGDADYLRNYLVLLGMLPNLLYMAMVLLGPAFVFNALLNVPLWVSILGSAIVATVYTSLGGLRAVVWTDAFQFFIMMAGMLAILIKVLMVVGGVRNMIDINHKYGRMAVFDLNPDPRVRHTVWTLAIGSFFFNFGLAITQQTVQRLNSTQSLADARKVLLIFAIMYSVLHFLGDVCGLAAFAYYAFVGCDPIESGRIKNPNQIVIAMISDLFTDIPGLAGLIISAVISASLSSLSSGYNGLAAIASEELFRHKFKDWRQSKKTMAAKVMVACFGFISTLLALTMLYVPGSFAQMTVSILGALASPVSGMFLVCFLYKRVRSNSVLVGGIAGLLVSLWLSMGFNFSPTLPPTPWLQPGPTDRCELKDKAGYAVDNENLTRVTANSYYNMTADEIVFDNRVQSNFDIAGKYEPYNEMNAFNNNTSKWSGFHDENSTVKPYRSVHYNETTTDAKEDRHVGRKGVDNFYSISYQYFVVVPILITATISLVVNICVSTLRSKKTDHGESESHGLHLREQSVPMA